MGSDGEEHLVDADSLQLLGLGGFFNKHLLVEIVVVLSDVLLCLTQQAHDVHPLLQLLARQVTGHDLDS